MLPLFPVIDLFLPSYLELFRGIISLPLTLSWFVIECLWEFLYVVCREFFKHTWATFLIGDSNHNNHNHLILCFHNRAYNDPRYMLLCDLQLFLSMFGHSTCSSVITMFIFPLSPTLTHCFHLGTIHLLLPKPLVASNPVIECLFNN